MPKRKKLTDEYQVDWSEYHTIAENVSSESVFFIRFNDLEVLNFAYDQKKIWRLFLTMHLRQALRQEGLNGVAEVSSDQEITLRPYTRTEEEQHKWEEFDKSTDISKFLQGVKNRAARATDHFTKNLLDPLHRAVIRLAQESSIASIISEAKETGIKLKPTAEIMRWIDDSLHAESQLIRRRVGTQLGGNRKRKGKFGSIDDLMELAETVDSLRPLWDCVTDFFASNDYEAGCIEMLKESSSYKGLAQDISVPDDLLRDVYKRKSKNAPVLEPLGFAIEHARRLLNLELKFNSLRTHYFKGKKLLEDEAKSVVNQ
jgi:hypothetical protein